MPLLASSVASTYRGVDGCARSTLHVDLFAKSHPTPMEGDSYYDMLTFLTMGTFLDGLGERI